MAEVHLTILGSGTVGKTSMLNRYLGFEFEENQEPTIEDFFTSTERINNINYKIKIQDTAGEQDYQNLLDTWINFGAGFLLVFAINDVGSFKALSERYERILNFKKNLKVPIILVGNKNDLESERTITQEQAKQLASKWKCEYYETSAKTGEHCKEVFLELAKKVIAVNHISGNGTQNRAQQRKQRQQETECGCIIN